ncbi:MAG: DUF58 domain-containing protein [Alphaproteobacteria bacterium]|nr:DUF58 domain-containing protein [Alphaproteobacteria bacterium]
MTSNETQAIRHDAEKVAELFPALLVEAERIAQTVAAGLHGRRRAGPGETFWQHRPYASGDPVSMIDWRQSARVADRLYIRQNEWEAAAAVYIWRDPSHSMNFSSQKTTPTKRRRADILCVALSILLSQAGERIGILGEERRPFHGRNTASRFLEALHVDAFDDARCTPPPAHLPTGARVVLVSDFFSETDALRATVEALTGAGAKGVLLQICDPAEEDFPFHGRVEFRDIESKERLTFGETASLQSDYKIKFTAHREALTNLATTAGWTFLSHRTDKPAQMALMALYTALGDTRVWTK